MTRWILAACLMALWACGVAATDVEGARLEVQLSMATHGRVEIVARVMPIGPSPFRGRMAEAHWEIEAKDGATGPIRLELPTLLPLNVGDTWTYVTWAGVLPPGAYTITWAASCEETERAAFRVVEAEGVRVLEAEARYLDPDSEHVRPLPDEPAWTGDPEARRLAAWARAALARALAVARDEIEIVEVSTREFSDASLGVRELGRVYAQVITPGYVIRMKWGDRRFEYRAAGERLVRVPELPGYPPPEELWIVQSFAYNADADVALHGQLACCPEAVLALPRWVDGEEDPIEAALRLVLEGDLGTWETDAGFSTEYPLPGLELVGLDLDRGVLTVCLDDPEHATTGGSCRTAVLRTQLEKAAGQFPSVEEILLFPEELFQP